MVGADAGSRAGAAPGVFRARKCIRPVLLGGCVADQVETVFPAEVLCQEIFIAVGAEGQIFTGIVVFADLPDGMLGVDEEWKDGKGGGYKVAE